MPLLLAAALMACTQELSVDLSGVRTFDSFSAAIEDDQVSKVQMKSAASLTWEEGDVIMVFSDAEPDPVQFTMGSDGQFHGSPVTGSVFTAYYGDLSYSNGVLQTNWHLIPFSGKPDSGSLPMVAVSSTNHLSFKQTCGIIHIKVTGSDKWTDIAFQGLSSELIAAKGTIDYTAENPCLVLDPDMYMRHNLVLDELEYDVAQGVDVYFPLAPTVFEDGFIINLTGESKTYQQFTTNRVELARGAMLSYTLNTDEPEKIYHPGEKERQVLIDLYNALDGPNWSCNSNWCSEQPLDYWYGVRVEDEHVVEISLMQNGCKGTIPESLSQLKHLKSISISAAFNGQIDGWENLFSLTNLTSLRFGNYMYWSDFDDKYMCEIPSSICNMKNLKSLELYGVKGAIPEGLYDLDLENIRFDYYKTDGGISPKIGQLKNLNSFYIVGLDGGVKGTIPDEFYNCTNLRDVTLVETGLSGSLSPKIGNLTKLKGLNLCGNHFSGSLPKELANIHFMQNAFAAGETPTLFLYSNEFSGSIPEEFYGWEDWNWFFGYVMGWNNDMDYSTARPQIIPFDVVTLDGSHFTNETVKNNEMTVFFSWDSTSCPASIEFSYTLDNLYEKYKDKGFDILGWSLWEDESVVRAYATSRGWKWHNFKASYEDNNAIGYAWDIWPFMTMPTMAVYDKNGELIFTDAVQSRSDFADFVDKWFGADVYESSDYSADGSAHVLQTATEGNGIDIVLMGDAYSDRLIADGTYASVMNRAMEAFFEVEPYHSYRNRFNVRYVDVVSKNEIYNGETALGTWYGEGTTVGGNNDKVLEYGKNALTAAGRPYDNALFIVLMNRDYFAGTCYMNGILDGDYAQGTAFAYIPVYSSENIFGNVLRHEAGGHGFARLADEYYYERLGTIPQEKIDSEYHSREPYGWWRNVDFTADPSAVKWSAFITDNRFASEGIGVYEGACMYIYGAYRPTENSIMNDNTGIFNAPSRYAIWYRINKLSNGSEWTGTYEDFVSWDLNHRSAQAPARIGRSRAPEKPLPPLAPPVVMIIQDPEQ